MLVSVRINDSQNASQESNKTHSEAIREVQINVLGVSIVDYASNLDGCWH